MSAIGAAWGSTTWSVPAWATGTWGAVAPIVPTVVTVIYSRGTASPGESEVTICNLALSHLGVSKHLISLTERSTEASACNLWYTRCRDELLRGFAWPFAVTIGDLALVSYMPNGPEWTYSYAVPDDALAVLRLPYGSSRNPTREILTKYRIQRNPLGGQLVYTDQDIATNAYIKRMTDPEEFPVDFVIALSYLIASRICATVTSENRRENTAAMLLLHKQTLAASQMHAANEEAPDIEPESGFISSRN